MAIPIVQVDAFTDTPFRGNPAAVALLEPDDRPSDAVLQSIALEMNLSETAYPVLRHDGDWDLRWFTPIAEVDLCGHATLASAHVLFERELVSGDEVAFHTRSGILRCRRGATGIIMDFPASRAVPCAPIEGLAAALGAEVVDQGRSFDLVVELSSPEAVAGLEPDLGALADLDTRAVIATARGDVNGGSADFVSRVFAPRVGIAEDPVTGSAHCITGPWWADRLGKKELVAHQVSGRGGHLGVRLTGDRVELTGRAVTVMEGSLVMP
jgi:PhzF family phenazine biosynthesis protein